MCSCQNLRDGEGELISKCRKVNKQKNSTMTDNSVVEKVLGDKGIICVEKI